MTLQTVARRYAAALFDVVGTGPDLDRAERDLAAIRAIFESHADLRKVFQTPVVPVANKRAMLTDLLKSAGGTSPHIERLLMLMADRDRLGLIPQVAEAFEARVRVARRVVSADVVTAVPLSDERRAALAASLGRLAGQDVTINARVDPSIIGGVVARVGSVVFDGSVTRQLERMRERLLSEA